MALPSVLCLLFPALAACVAASPEILPQGPDPRLIDRATASAAAQVRRCYRAPRVSADVRRQIVTRLRVRYAADGMLVQSPQLVEQLGVTPANRPYALMMAHAAIQAVIRCAPIRLPPELHQGGWDDFELVFSPAAPA